MIVWVNGTLCDEGEVRIDPADRGFTLGDGLFETIAMRSGQILRLEAHRARFQQGCETLGIPFPTVELSDVIDAVCKANNLFDASVRLTLTRGPAARGLVPPPAQLHPTLLVTTASLPGSPPPARCVIATVTRRNEHSPLARIKSLNYLDGILARREAVGRGANEAILLNTAGKVAETAVANLFMVKNGLIYTPPVEDGALPGVMRATVLSAYECIQKSLLPNDILTADGIFLTNSLGIRTVSSIDGKPAGNAARAYMESIKGKLAI